MKNEPAGKRHAGGWLGPRPVPEDLRRGRDVSGSRPAVEVYGWQVRERPLSIKIPIDIVERMQEEIQYGLSMRTPCDVIGILIGRLAKEYSSTITIHDYVLAGYTNDSAGSGLWNDQRLADLTKPWNNPNSASYVVGFFRSRSDGWPEIVTEDLKRAKRLLQRTPNIFLLIRSGLGRGYSGRLFLRPFHRAKVDEEYGEFPLNAGVLRTQWEATAPKSEDSGLHFIPGNPLQGKPRHAPRAVEAVFEPVMRPDDQAPPKDVSAEAPPVEPVAAASALDVPAEPAKQSLWAKLFQPAAKLFRPATEETPSVEAVAAAIAMDALRPEPAAAPHSEIAAEPIQQDLWATMFRSVAEEPPSLHPIPVSTPIADSTPIAASTPLDTSAAEAAEAAAAPPSEQVTEPPAMEETPGAWDAPWQEPERQPFWARLLGRLREEDRRDEPISATSAHQLEDEAAAAEMEEPTFEDHPSPAPVWRSWLSVAATWTIAVAVTMWCLSGPSPLPTPKPEVSETRPAVISNPIGLQVDSAGGLLEIAWDPISVAAMTSSGGFLTIRDGSLLKQVHLDSVEIQSGHLYYGARNTDLGIRLEVAGDDGATASESIRVVGPPPHGTLLDK